MLNCHKMRLNCVGPSDETAETEAPCHGRCGRAGVAERVWPSRCGRAGVAERVWPSRCGRAGAELGLNSPAKMTCSFERKMKYS